MTNTLGTLPSVINFFADTTPTFVAYPSDVSPTIPAYTIWLPDVNTIQNFSSVQINNTSASILVVLDGTAGGSYGLAVAVVQPNCSVNITVNSSPNSVYAPFWQWVHSTQQSQVNNTIMPANGGTGVAEINPMPVPSILGYTAWDENSNLTANNFLPFGPGNIIPTAAGTGFTNALGYTTIITGSTTGFIFGLPETFLVNPGTKFFVINNATVSILISTFFGHDLITLPPVTPCCIELIFKPPNDTTYLDSTSWAMTFPTNDLGADAQVWTSNGPLDAPTWQPVSSASGTVTSVGLTVPSFLSVSGSPVTTSGTLAVTLSGTALPIANGGTSHTTALAAFNALSPLTTGGDLLYGGASGSALRLANGTSGQVLTSSGTTLAPTWQTVTGTGSVTSVAMTVPSFLSVSGSPITASGTLGVTLSGTALPIANGGTALTALPTSVVASTYSAWDANSNLNANGFISAVSVLGNSNPSLLITTPDVITKNAGGTDTYTLPVPSTALIGKRFLIHSFSSGSVSVHGSGGTSLLIVSLGNCAEFICVQNGTDTTSWMYNVRPSNILGSTAVNALLTAFGGTGTITAPTAGSVVWGATASAQGYTAAGTSGQPLLSGGAGVPTWGTLGVANGGTSLTALPTSSAASTFAAWDANANLHTKTIIPDGFATYASAGGNTSLTVSSPYIFYSTGSTAFNLTMPSSSVSAGQQW